MREQKEIVIRIPVTILPPNELARAAYLRDVKSNPNNDFYTAEERTLIGGEIYEAGAKLLALVQSDPDLLHRVILGYAHTEIDVAAALADESFDDVLRAAVDKLPDCPERTFLQRNADDDGLFLIDRAEAITRAIKFGEIQVAIE